MTNLTLNTEQKNEANKLVFLQDKIYGNVLYYPGNPAAQAIVSVAGRKTLEWKHLQKLDELGGFEIEVKSRY
jgi:hypothetical protein